MADIASLIANSAQTNADFNFGKISDAYYKGQDEAQKNALRNAFSGGIPLGPDGQPDYGAMSKKLFELGDVSNATALSNLDIQRQNLAHSAAFSQAAGRLEGGQGFAPQTSSVPPSLNRSASVSTASDLTKQQQPQSTIGSDVQPTVRSILATQGINDPLGETATSLAHQLGVNPNDPIDINDPQISNVLRPAIAQYKRMGVGQVYTPGQATPQPQVVPSVVQAQADQQPAIAQPGVVSNPVDPETQRKIAFYTRAAGDPGLTEAEHKLAITRLEALQRQIEPTPEMKAAAASGLSLQKYQERLGEQAAQQARDTAVAQADVKEQTGVIDAGRAASKRMTTLNTILNVAQNDKNVGFGYGAENELKIKMALERLWPDAVGDLSGALLIQKMNSVLAAESTKEEGGSRPTQFVFKTFLANNPGLLMDKNGTIRLAGIFAQLSKRDYELGKLARQNRDNWDNWDNVVEKYDAEKGHEIIDPISKKRIFTNTIVAPGAANTASTAAPASINSKADYDKLPPGATFTGPDGKPWQKPK